MHTDDAQSDGRAPAVDGTDLAAWLVLADDVARQHRQGRVLGTDPALVLRGLAPVWRTVAAGGTPADDVVTLAGAALARVDAADPIRPSLVEAAAGCRGSDLPALVREVRSALEGRPPAPPDGGATVADDPSGASTGQHGEAGPRAPGRRRHRRSGRSEGGTGRRLGLAGAAGAAALAVLGAIGGTGGGVPAATLGPRATEVPLDGERVALVSWDLPHLTVEVGPTRYRYRLDGPVDDVALQAGESGPRLLVQAGDDRWELAVPALGATGPGTTGSG